MLTQQLKDVLTEFRLDQPECRRVLVVDDEVENLDVLSAILEDCCEVHTAQTGEQALTTLEALGGVDVVVADQRMPGISGVELLTRIANISPETVRIVLTAYSDIEPMLEAINCGSAYRFLIKPFDATELRSVVTDCLRLKGTSAALTHLLETLHAHKNKLANTLKELRDRQNQLLAAERLATLGRTTSGIVHDLRNASSVLYALLDLIRRDTDQLTVVDSAEAAWSSLGALIDLLEQIRDFARSSSTRPHREPTNIREFLDGTVKLFYLEQGSERCPIRVNVDLENPIISVDRSRIRQAAMALLRNAVRASAPGSGIAVTVRPTDGNAIMIDVIDNGHGMTLETIERAREPFYSAFDPPGVGLGLEIVRLAAEAHGGSLTISSKQTEGTTASVWLADVEAKGLVGSTP